jgi:hypothetical protein
MMGNTLGGASCRVQMLRYFGLVAISPIQRSAGFPMAGSRGLEYPSMCGRPSETAIHGSLIRQ